MISPFPAHRIARAALCGALYALAVWVPDSASAQAIGGADPVQQEAAQSEQEALDCSGPAWHRRGTACEDVLPPPYDLRRTIGKLPQNFARGVVGVFSLDNLPTLVWGSAATGLAFASDGNPKPPGFEGGEFGEIGHFFGEPAFVGGVAVGLLVAGRIADAQPVRDWTYDLFLATGVNLLYTETLKRTVTRTRPDGSNDHSFPSGHTSNVFAWATVIDRHYGPGIGIPMCTLATLIGLSRNDRGSHYTSDIVAGAVIGIIVGRTVTRQNSLTMDDGPQFNVIPIVGPAGGSGIGLHVVF
ncbi:MAG: phosphatase PAP2 family protein [Acidobacteria bacterium]|nr:phosphatase PAP2 family protein [Acidobacteriota bacterium]